MNWLSLREIKSGSRPSKDYGSNKRHYKQTPLGSLGCGVLATGEDKADAPLVYAR